MAYRFKLGEPMSTGVVRVGLEQIRRAKDQLETADTATGVHEARKCLKRLRALLRLVRTGIGEDVFVRENTRFRDTARLLAGARDTTVLLKTVTDLMLVAEPQDRSALEQLRSSLAGQIVSRKDEGEDNIGTALRKLEQAETSWQELRLTPDSFDTVAEGLGRTYARCRRLWREASSSGRPEVYHEWRKDLQRHWRQMRLVQNGWPEYFAARTELASELSDLLGSMQDLSIFVAFVSGPGGESLKRRKVERLVQLAQSRQLELREIAEPRAERLCADSRSSLCARARAYWSSAAKIRKRPLPSKVEETVEQRTETEPAVAVEPVQGGAPVRQAKRRAGPAKRVRPT